MIANPGENSRTARIDADGWFGPGQFAALLAVLIVVCYPKIVFGTESFFFRDFGNFGYPLAFHYRESFWRGEMPFWNPFNCFGLPFLAQWNTLTLYPGSLFYLIFPLPWSLGVFCLGHLFLAGLGMYFLARCWIGNRLAASVAGVIFTFNGLTLQALMWPNNIAALGWMPWVVLAAQRAWREGGRAIIVAGLAGAMQMLAGAPEIILLTWLLLGILWLGELFGGRLLRWRASGRFFCVVCLVAGLSAAQLFPFADLLAHSQRDAHFGGSQWAMPVWGWANFIVPLFRCSPTVLGVFSQNEQQWTSSYYLGIGTLALAMLALWQVRQQRVGILAVAALAGVILAMGENGRVLGWIRQIFPSVGVMRFPIKMIVLTAFTLPLLAAFGLNGFLRAPPSDARVLRRRTLWVAIILLLALTGILMFARFFPRSDDSWSVTLESGLSRAVFLMLVLGAACLLLRTQSARIRGLTGVSVLLLLALDALTHTPNQNPTASLHAFGPLEIEKQVAARYGESRASLDPRLQAFLSHAATPDPFNYYTTIRRALYLDCNLLDHIPTASGFFSLDLRESAKVQSLLDNAASPPPASLADFIGASQISSPDIPLAWNSRPNFMLLVTGGQKPAFANPDETFQALSSPDFDPRSTVYLPLEAHGSIAVTRKSAPRISPRAFSAQKILFDTRADEPALIVVAQAFYHPWRAYVDGRPVALLKANYAFQALEIPAGSHSVSLAYEDSSFRAGAIISSTALAFCLVAWLAGKKRRIDPSSLLP